MYKIFYDIYCVNFLLGPLKYGGWLRCDSWWFDLISDWQWVEFLACTEKKSQRKTRQLLILITHCTLTTGCSNASRWILSWTTLTWNMYFITDHGSQRTSTETKLKIGQKCIYMHPQYFSKRTYIINWKSQSEWPWESQKGAADNKLQQTSKCSEHPNRGYVHL